MPEKNRFYHPIRTIIMSVLIGNTGGLYAGYQFAQDNEVRFHTGDGCGVYIVEREEECVCPQTDSERIFVSNSIDDCCLTK